MAQSYLRNNQYFMGSSRPEYRPDQYQYGGDSMLGKMLPIQRRILKPESQSAEFVGYDDTGRPIYDVVTTPAELGPVERGPSLMSRMLGGLRNAYSAATEDPQAMAGALGGSMQGQIEAAAAGGRVWDPETQQMVEFDPMMAAVGAAPGGVGALRVAEPGSVVLGAMGGKDHSRMLGGIPQVSRDMPLLQRVGDVNSVNKSSVEMSGGNLGNVPMLKAEDIIDRPFVSGMADTSRSALEKVSAVDGVPVDATMWGGQYYGFQPYNLENNIIWSNAKGGTSGILNRAKEAAELPGARGNPIFIPYGMGGKSSDFSTMTTDLMVPYSSINMSKKAKKALDERIRSGAGNKKNDKQPVPDWPGIDSPDVMSYLQNAGGRRIAVAKALDEFRDEGAMSLSRARSIIVDPSQLYPRVGDLHAAYEININKAPSAGLHPSYPVDIYGRALGGFTEGANLLELSPLMGGGKSFLDEMAERGHRVALGETMPSAAGKVLQANTYGKFDQPTVDYLISKGFVLP